MTPACAVGAKIYMRGRQSRNAMKRRDARKKRAIRAGIRRATGREGTRGRKIDVIKGKTIILTVM